MVELLRGRGYNQPVQLIKILPPQAIGFLEEFDLDEDKKLSFSEFKKAVATIKKKGTQGALEVQGQEQQQEQEEIECLETLDGLQEGEFKKAVEILKIIKNAVRGIKRKDVKKEVDLHEGTEEHKAVESLYTEEVQEELEIQK